MQKKKAIKRKVWWSLHLTLRRFQDDIPAQVSGRLISIGKKSARPAARGRDARQQGRIRTWANLSRNLKAFCFSEARKRSITFLTPIDARKGRRHGSPRYPLSTLLLGDTAEFSRPWPSSFLSVVSLYVNLPLTSKPTWPHFPLSVHLLCGHRLSLAEQKQCTLLRLVRPRSTRIRGGWREAWRELFLPPSSPMTSGCDLKGERRGKAPLLSAPAVVEPFPIPSSGEHRHRSVKAKGAGDIATEAAMPRWCYARFWKKTIAARASLDAAVARIQNSEVWMNRQTRQSKRDPLTHPRVKTRQIDKVAYWVTVHDFHTPKYEVMSTRFLSHLVSAACFLLRAKLPDTNLR
jgi:hypothetical protein